MLNWRKRGSVVLVASLCHALSLLPLAAADTQQANEVDLRHAFRDDVDQRMAELWREKGITPAPLCSDSEFLRRAYLDLAGVIPAVSEARAFLQDEDAQKRERLIERLLASPRYATHMANTWRDIILVQDFAPEQRGTADQLQRWLRQQFVVNMRYDRIVADFLSVSGDDAIGPAIFYQTLQADPAKLAAATSRVFLGLQIQCAECHDHPFDRWTQKDFWGYAAFFAQLDTSNSNASADFRVVDLDDGDVMLPKSDQIVPPRLPGGHQPNHRLGGTRRRQLAIWMASRDNPFLAKAAVNRVWAQLFGRGLVDPVDEMGPQNPAVHPQLLQEIADYFVASGFDLRELYHVLTLTNVYQRSSRADESNQKPRFFERMAMKRQTADQLYDSLSRSLILPSVMAGQVDGRRAEFLRRMHVHDSDATQYNLGVQQVLFLLNGGALADVTTSGETGILAALEAPFLTDQDRVEILFLATLSRFPTPSEQTTCRSLLDQRRDSPHMALGNLLWALVNSVEYQLNH